jgi:hypothetical protein
MVYGALSFVIADTVTGVMQVNALCRNGGSSAIGWPPKRRFVSAFLRECTQKKKKYVETRAR